MEVEGTPVMLQTVSGLVLTVLRRSWDCLPRATIGKSDTGLFEGLQDHSLWLVLLFPVLSYQVAEIEVGQVDAIEGEDLLEVAGAVGVAGVVSQREGELLALVVGGVEVSITGLLSLVVDVKEHGRGGTIHDGVANVIQVPEWEGGLFEFVALRTVGSRHQQVYLLPELIDDLHGIEEVGREQELVAPLENTLLLLEIVVRVGDLDLLGPASDVLVALAFVEVGENDAGRGHLGLEVLVQTPPLELDHVVLDQVPVLTQVGRVVQFLHQTARSVFVVLALAPCHGQEVVE